MTKLPVARKLAVGQLVFWLLVVSSFNYFKMHAWSTSMLLLLHSAFILRVVKLLLKGKDGICALNSHRNYIVDHGKSWNCVFEFLWVFFLIFVGKMSFSASTEKFEKISKIFFFGQK